MKLALLLLALLVMVTFTLSFASPGNSRLPDDEEDADEGEEDDDPWDFPSLSTIQEVKSEPKRPCIDMLPVDKVNDNYCDCEDGSDEPTTAACSMVEAPKFACHNGDQRISAGFVGDGVCDCCDGSDEVSTVGVTSCPNVCVSHYEEERVRLEETLEMIQRGLKQRELYLQKADDVLAELRGDFEAMLAIYRALKQEMQLKQQEFQASGRQPTMEEFQVFDRLRYEFMSTQNRAFVLQRVAAAFPTDIPGSTQLSVSSGTDKKAFAALIGRCFNATVDEKQLKGGTPNVIPRSYVFQLCPFQNVTQYEPSYVEWARTERWRKSSAVVDESLNSGEEEPTPLLLGIWEKWVDAIGFPSKQQRYDHGSTCFNGQERVTIVETVCGDDNVVEVVEEPEMCVYRVRFATPAACEPEEEVSAQKYLEAVHKVVKGLGSDVRSFPHEEL